MKKITRKNLEKFLKEYSTNELILDIGAGRVETNHSYIQFFPNRHTIDIDAARMPDTVGDIHALPFNDCSFSFILCTEVLEHCHTPQKAIDEMYRVLKPGGKLVLTTRFVYPIHDAPHDYFRYTKYGLRHLFKNWNIEVIKPETETFSALGALFQRIGFQTNMRGGKFTKFLLYLAAWLFDNLNWLLKEEYGNIQKSKSEETIISTGYYLVAKRSI
jgi:SAM-dependent methyltransferase